MKMGNRSEWIHPVKIVWYRHYEHDYTALIIEQRDRSKVVFAYHDMTGWAHGDGTDPTTLHGLAFKDYGRHMPVFILKRFLDKIVDNDMRCNYADD